MLAAPWQDWNVFPQICGEHWDGFTHVYPRYHQPSYDGLVDKRLGGGHPEKMGYRAYPCLHWGQGTQRVALSCQSSLCGRCATVYGDTWGSQGSRLLHAGGSYRHSVLTVPARLRQTFYPQSKDVLSPCMRCGVRCREDVFSRVSGRTLQGGSIVVVQPQGRQGQYNPPLHVIATRGGWDQEAPPWLHLDDVP